MLRRSVVALSLVGLLAGTGVALAQATPAQASPGQRAHGMSGLQKHLGLSEDQAKAVKAAYEKHRAEQKQAYQALRVAQTDLRQLALNGGDTTAKTAEVQQLMGQTIALRVKVLQEIGPVLTPEQRAKFAQVDTHRGKRQHRKAPTQS